MVVNDLGGGVQGDGGSSSVIGSLILLSQNLFHGARSDQIDEMHFLQYLKYL